MHPYVLHRQQQDIHSQISQFLSRYTSHKNNNTAFNVSGFAQAFFVSRYLHYHALSVVALCNLLVHEAGYS